MNVNLDKFFDAQKPTITVFSKTYQVDNDYKKVIGIQALGMAIDKKGAQQDNTGGLRSFLEYSLVDGKAAADEILSHSFGFEFYNRIINGITAAMTGKTLEEVEEIKKAAMAGGRFPGSTKKWV